MKTLRLAFTLSAIVGCLFTNNAWCQQASSNTTVPDALRAVNPTTAILVQAEPNRIRMPEWLNNSGAAVVGNRLVDLMKSAAGSSDFYVTIDIPYSSTQSVVRLLVPATNPTEIETAKARLAKLSVNEPIAENGFVVASPTHDVRTNAFPIDETLLPVDQGRFAAAAKQVAQYSIRMLFVPPAHVWETYDELLPELPSKLGGGPTSVVTQGIEWAAIGGDLENTTLVTTIQSQNAEAAETLAKRLPAMLKRIIDQLPDIYDETLVTSIDAIVDLAKIEVVNDQIQITIRGNDEQSPSSILAAIVNATGVPIASNKKRDLMRQIVLGIINYESTYGCFPPAKKFRGPDGTSGLSWRVHILPFIDEYELYTQFHLDEPWDTAHNIKLVERMPDIYNTFSKSVLIDPVLKPGHTTFVAPVSDGTILGGKEITKVRHVADGLSKTVLLVEVNPGHAVPWTAPQDYYFSPDDPGAGLAWDRNDNVAVSFSDGAWMLLPKSTSKETIRDLFLMNDGHAIDLK